MVSGKSEKNGQMPRVSLRLGIRIRRAMFALRRLLVSRLAPLGFTPEQYMVLLHLGELQGSTQIELAQRSFTNPNTMSDILRRLEAAGLVRRVPHEQDGRALRVEITNRGKKMRSRMIALADEITALVLDDLSADQRETFLGCLDHVAQTAEAAVEGGAQKAG